MKKYDPLGRDPFGRFVRLAPARKKWRVRMPRTLLVHIATVLLFAVAVGAAVWTAVETHKLLEDARAALQSTNALIKDAQASLDDNYYDAKATMETVATTAKDTDDFVRDLHKQTSGTLTEAQGLLSDARGLVTGMRADVDRLTDSADTDAKALDADLAKIGQLTEDLDGEIRSGAATAKKTAADLQAALSDLDKLLADPNLKAILASSAKTSDHLAESAESVDIALRPWRKKASQLKMIVEKALGLVKIVIPL
jgi:chromosome segregation ATPase